MTDQAKDEWSRDRDKRRGPQTEQMVEGPAFEQQPDGSWIAKDPMRGRFYMVSAEDYERMQAAQSASAPASVPGEPAPAGAGPSGPAPVSCEHAWDVPSSLLPHIRRCGKCGRIEASTTMGNFVYEQGTPNTAGSTAGGQGGEHGPSTPEQRAAGAPCSPPASASVAARAAEIEREAMERHGFSKGWDAKNALDIAEIKRPGYECLAYATLARLLAERETTKVAVVAYTKATDELIAALARQPGRVVSVGCAAAPAPDVECVLRELLAETRLSVTALRSRGASIAADHLSARADAARAWLSAQPEQGAGATCIRCHGTGVIDAPTSGDDPSCPDCDGEGTTTLMEEREAEAIRKWGLTDAVLAEQPPPAAPSQGEVMALVGRLQSATYAHGMNDAQDRSPRADKVAHEKSRAAEAALASAVSALSARIITLQASLTAAEADCRKLAERAEKAERELNRALAGWSESSEKRMRDQERWLGRTVSTAALKRLLPVRIETFRLIGPAGVEDWSIVALTKMRRDIESLISATEALVANDTTTDPPKETTDVQP